MRTEAFSLMGPDGVCLPGQLWLPDAPPRMIVQITHGMTEHIGRFAQLAEALAAVDIAAVGFDLRGHGKNPGNADCASLGADGWQASLSDIEQLSAWITDHYPGVPRALLGFSLGSFLVRENLCCSSTPPCAVILLGTGWQPGPVLSLLKSLVGSQIRKAGFDRTTPLVQKLSFGAYNQGFRPCRTEADWLCADTAQLNAYLADPLCRRTISAGLFWQLLDSMQRTGRPHAADGWPKKVPVLLLSGAEDPVGSKGKGVTAVQTQLQKAGLAQVHMQLIPGARHDVLHEEASGAAQTARASIVQFLLACL